MKINLEESKISVLEYTFGLYRSLRRKLEYNRKYYRSSDYRWKLGINIINDLKCDSTNVYFEHIGNVSTLFGIEIDVICDNPDSIELWMNITDEI